jgi:NAD(P)-dependent dehydrogenase (short-subunit alcohol dehydrogenase family)
MTILEELFTIKGKVVVITGGGGAIGQETALLLSSVGAIVVLVDRNLAAAQEGQRKVQEQGGDAMALECDITVPEQVKQAFASVLTQYKRLDILVNNAALVRRVPALETTLEEWREVMDVNLNAAFNCSTEAARHMRNEGAIINLASIMGISGGGAYPIASYHASKGGLINLTRALAIEWAHLNIRVNAIAPTWVRTEFTKALLDDPTVSSELLRLMPLRRFAETRDVAAAVLYLASPAARMVTGHVLAVDGGYLAS